MAPRRETSAGGRRADLGVPVRLRPGLLPQRRSAHRQGHGALLLPAQDGESPRGASLERRVQLRSGRARPAPRHDPRDRADRDDSGGVRDGRNPVGAARPRRRPQLRALGLHLQLHQEIQEPARVRAPRSRPRDDGAAIPAGVRGPRDPALNAQALEKVRQDKLREVRQGHDGTWVAHPALVPVAREVFDAHMKGPHQIALQREDVLVTARDLLATPPGDVTAAGLRTNLDVALRYLAAWLGGSGAVPIYDLMEDAATAEISRAQVWQWLRHGVRLQDGRPVTAALVQQLLAELVETLPERVGADGVGGPQFSLAGRILAELATGPEFAEFLTTVAYEYLD